MRSPWFLRATARGAMGAAVRSVDWAATPLGPPAAWPLPLRAAVELCLGTEFPVLVTWGPELTMIYNDGYREMLGTDKHPGALGSPLAAVWAEVWDAIEPSVREVEAGRPTWVVDQRLVMHRSGFDEETFFTYSYSPLLDVDGQVRGLLDIATESTAQVVERRRVGQLSLLQARLQAAGPDVGAVVAAAAATLADGPDLTLVGAALGPRGGLRWVHGPADDVDAALVERAARTATVQQAGRLLVVPLPLVAIDDREGLLALRAGALRPVDDQLRTFARLVADAVAGALTGALRHEREVGMLERVSDVLQRAMLEPPVDRPGVATRYVPATRGLAVGGDWYDVADLPGGRTGIVVGDLVGHGLESASRMGQLRSAARALLLRTDAPAPAVDGLDAFARTLPGAEYATMHCGVLDPAAGTYTYTSAGHPPAAVLRTDGTVTWLTGARGTPLTVAREPRPHDVVAVAAGDVVVLCTDGLLERRGSDLRSRLAALERLLVGLVGADPDAIADGVLAGMTPEGSLDDTAVVVHRVEG